MKKRYILSLVFLAVALLIYFLTIYLQNNLVEVLEPMGPIAAQEKHLLANATWLMLLIGIPVILMTFFIAWRYRAGNKKATYTPDWDMNHLAESVWWGFPLLIVIGLAIMTWTSTHELDPFKPIETGKKPLTIQVVALQWKWLFIYPEEKIASMSLVQFPKGTPIRFEITSDAPMNSFWIPQLAGQMYAMPGMKSQLHLIADKEGSFNGSSANLSGEGFASMKFIAKATSEEEFVNWVQMAKESPNQLTRDAYRELMKPTIGAPCELFSLQDMKLYDWIIMKYMVPMPTTRGGEEDDV